MSKRLKILLSAYACRPGYGGESGIGWNMALQASRYHEVTVLTRTRNQSVIEPVLVGLASPKPTFAYFEAPRLFLTSKKALPGSAWWYYGVWQRHAVREVARLHAEKNFHLLHHLTWASFRATTAVWGQGVPVVWGPMAGGETTPPHLLPWGHPRQLLHELIRIASNHVAVARLRRRAALSTAVLVSTAETQKKFADAGIPTTRLVENGVCVTDAPSWTRKYERVRLVYSGRLIFYKGVHLALRALKEAGTSIELTIFGDGSFRPALQRLSRKLGVASQVRFAGWVAREELLARYGEFDVFIFPSLHDGVPQALLEAMSCGLPAICLDSGGPAQVVTSDCGFKVPLGTLREIVRNLANAMSSYHRHPEQIRIHGFNAWTRAVNEFSWRNLGERINAVYQEAAARVTKTPQKCATDLPLSR